MTDTHTQTSLGDDIFQLPVTTYRDDKRAPGTTFYWLPGMRVVAVSDTGDPRDGGLSRLDTGPLNRDTTHGLEMFVAYCLRWKDRSIDDTPAPPSPSYSDTAQRIVAKDAKRAGDGKKRKRLHATTLDVYADGDHPGAMLYLMPHNGVAVYARQYAPPAVDTTPGEYWQLPDNAATGKKRTKALRAWIKANAPTTDGKGGTVYNGIYAHHNTTTEETTVTNPAPADSSGTPDLADMPLRDIARIILNDWKKAASDTNHPAHPYIEAMTHLDKITDTYISSTGDWIVARFLTNARGWHGDTARTVKAELKRRQAR
jgi:hypothetical protein